MNCSIGLSQKSMRLVTEIIEDCLRKNNIQNIYDSGIGKPGSPTGPMATAIDEVLKTWRHYCKPLYSDELNAILCNENFEKESDSFAHATDSLADHRTWTELLLMQMIKCLVRIISCFAVSYAALKTGPHLNIPLHEEIFTKVSRSHVVNW